MITEAQHILLETIKVSLFDAIPQFPLDVDWKAVVAEAKAQTVLALISSSIPVFDESSEQCKAMYMRIMYEQDRLISCFNAAKIPCVILKGSAAAVYYPKPYLRTMGDIDVLVQRKDLTESLRVLELNGYVYDHGKGDDGQVSEDTRELAYIKNGLCIEIHQRFSSPGVDVDDILEAAIKRREFIILNGYRFPILPIPENGLVLLGHLNQHLKNNVLGLRQIIDWEMYVHSVEDKVAWLKQFVPLAEKTGLITLAAYFTRMCNRYLGLLDEVDFGIDVDDTLVDELIEVVLNDGNFGRRIYSDSTADEKKMFNASYGIKCYGFFGYFTRVGMSTNAFCTAHSSLKFFAFIYGFNRQMTRGIRAIIKNKGIGKKMDDGKKMYEVHTKRRELYKQLGVRTGDE